MYKTHTHCRACGYAFAGATGIKSNPGDKLIEVFDLGIQPLANDFCGADKEQSGYAPLKVLFCPRCYLGQLSVTVRPDILYRHYSYVTSPSAMMRNHFQTLADDIASETDGKSLLEIGSNDGRFLEMMMEKGYSVLGVDPAENLSKFARENGIPTETGFFGEQLSLRLPISDIIVARHVFCHVDDWRDFVRGLEVVSHAKTLICIEVPYVGDMLKNLEFDTIYHEHLSYLSLNSMLALLKESKLCLHRIIRYPIHGGAVLLMLRHRDLKANPHNSVSSINEHFSVDDWKSFSCESKAQIDKLRAFVHGVRAEGKNVAGLGASAKSTVWINACGFKRKDISFISDSTLQKQWTMAPGTDIPITDEGAILRELPDYVIMWAWNYRYEILDKFAPARSKGVKFVVPVPRIEVI